MKCKRILYLGLDPSRLKFEGNLLHLPIIRTIRRPFFGQVEAVFQKLASYTHVIFTSRSAIDPYIDFAREAGQLNLSTKIYIAVGKATAALLEEKKLKASCIAVEETGEGVVDLARKLDFTNAHVFFPHSSKAREVIPNYFKEQKIALTTLALYDTEPAAVELPNLEEIDEIIFTSPSTVEAFLKLAPDFKDWHKCVAIGPITAKALKSMGN